MGNPVKPVVNIFETGADLLKGGKSSSALEHIKASDVPLISIDELLSTPVTKVDEQQNIKNYLINQGHKEQIISEYFVKNYKGEIVRLDEAEVINNKEKSLNETFCIGSNHELTNIDVAKQICQIINDNFNPKHDCLELIKYVDDRLGHDFRYAIDSTKIRENLQWKPNYSFNDGLIKTIDYYKENI